MKILFIADVHIKLDVPKVPNHWQVKRYHSMLEEINAIQQVDMLIIGGDLLDTSKPSTEELELMFALIAKLRHKTIIYSGNHELSNKKGMGKYSILSSLADEINRCNPLARVVTSYRSKDFDVVGYEEISNKTLDKPAASKLCFTHVRGEIQPHVKWEVDPRFFDQYDLVITGDLHSHENSQGKFIYPGSPLTTSFHRTRSTGNGYLIVDTDLLTWEWFSLSHLPQLLRKTVTTVEEMVEAEYDWQIYEVETNVLGSKDIKKTQLLDKKIVSGFAKDAILDLQGTPMSQEMQLFLTDIAKLPKQDVDRLVTQFNDYQRKYDENT